ncbi:MAG: cytochrome c oxidase subunit 3 family protein [Herpetosiphonaceae bacterium]|nr:cytochrome c oxidase subunit 3 family protein [Herpetosiphonaceae bacterium]
MLEPQPIVAHQFDDLAQQREADHLGMWLFLVTEVMFFGVLFTAYTLYRATSPHAFAAASRHLNVTLGTINTAVLLCSSLSMAFAVHAAEQGHRRRLMQCLLLTAGLGLLFLGIKAVEYYEEYREQLVPALNFTTGEPHADKIQLFFVLYFTMTGLHALHLTIGIGLVTLLLILAWRGRLTDEHHIPVDLIGLYWHFVDIVWVFVYPLLYLIDRRH